MEQEDGPSTVYRRLFVRACAAATTLASITSFIGTSAKVVSVSETSETVQISNDQLAVEIWRDNGGIKQIRSLRDGTTLRTEGKFPAEHWDVTFYHPDERGEILKTASRFAGEPEIHVDRRSNEATITLQYDRPRMKSSAAEINRNFDGQITAEVTVRSGEPLASFEISVTNNDDLSVKKIYCPEISNITPLTDDGTGAVITPLNMGRRHPDPVRQGTRTGATYPGASGTMQFFAYTGTETGFYADARDTDGHVKGFRWVPQRGSASDADLSEFRMFYRHPRVPGQDVEIPYTSKFGVMRGDWHDAAERYREWIDKEGWLPDTAPPKPEWLQRNGVTYKVDSYQREEVEKEHRTIDFERSAELAVEMREYLGTHIQCRWKGWSKHGSPAGGDWFPPKEGIEAFQDVLDRLDRHDIGFISYVNVSVGLQISDLWRENPEKVSDWAIRDPDGSLNIQRQDIIDYVLMEPTQSGWQNRYRTAIERLVEAGTNQIHLDGFRGKIDCYANHHDHPPGLGSNWFPQTMRDDLREMYQEYSLQSSGIVMEGERTADYFLPFMQMQISRDVTGPLTNRLVRENGEIIPLYNFTFDDYVDVQSAFGIPPGTAKSWWRDHLRIAIGRTVAWGSIPAFAFPKSPTAPGADERMLDYFSRVAQARTTYANRFFVRGEMLRSPNIETNTVSVEVVSPDVGEVTERSPAIRASAWRSPHDEVGIALTSVAPDSPRSTTIDLLAQPFSIPESPRLIYEVTNGDYERISGLDDSLTSVTVDLQREDVILLVVTAGTRTQERSLERLVEAQEKATNESERETLADAKRAFEAHRYDRASNLAQEVITGSERETSTTTTTEGANTATTTEGLNTATTTKGPNTEPTTSAVTQTTEVSTQTESVSQEDTRSTETPGFGIITGILGGISAFIYRLYSDTTDQQQED